MGIQVHTFQQRHKHTLNRAPLADRSFRQCSLPIRSPNCSVAKQFPLRMKLKTTQDGAHTEIDTHRNSVREHLLIPRVCVRSLAQHQGPNIISTRVAGE
jgi:hypothetical protein